MTVKMSSGVENARLENGGEEESEENDIDTLVDAGGSDHPLAPPVSVQNRTMRA